MSQIVYYSLRDLPANLETVDEMDLQLKWETAIDPDKPPEKQFNGIEELNALFEERIKKILKDRNARFIHVRWERISHSRNYAHNSSVIVGEYRFDVLK